MRTYLEAKQYTTEEAEFVRLDVTDKTPEEQDTILVTLKDFMTGIDCKIIKHFCYHDEGSGKPCELILRWEKV